MPRHSSADISAPPQAHLAPERVPVGDTLQLSPRIAASVSTATAGDGQIRHGSGRAQAPQAQAGEVDLQSDHGVADVLPDGAAEGVLDDKDGRNEGVATGEVVKRRKDKDRLSPILNRHPMVGQESEAGPSSTPMRPITNRNLTSNSVNVGINNNGQPVPRSPNPEFAELLTPAKLRRRKRHTPRVTLPAAIAGPSREGWQTGDDVYRGALNDPTVPPDAGAPGIDEEAISLGGSSSSSSSSGTGSTWSIVSDLERGRRRTVAAIERFGERVGLRRASSASSEHSVGSMLDRQRSEVRHRSSRRMSQRLTRNLTLTRSRSRRSSIDSSHSAAPRRQYIPRKRQFTLLVEGETTTTPSLANVLGRIKDLRVQAGLEAPSRGGSGPGRKRPNMQRGKTSFVPPPKPVRPLGRLGTQSRLSALRGNAGLMASPAPSPPLAPAGTPTGGALGNGLGPRPLTPAEIMGLTSPASAPNLTSLKEFPSNPITDPPSPSKRSSLDSYTVPSGAPDPAGSTASLLANIKPKVTWWLDVGCPTWEDLRDIGELLALHPLTLEDVLQQDPREKMDVFEQLGYYFIVVRALDETYFKYTPGSSSVASVGKTPPPSVPGSSAASHVSAPPVDAEKTGGSGTRDGEREKSGGMSSSNSPDLVAHQAQAKKEGRRRGWGMGRAVGKLAGRQGEKVELVEDNPGKEGLEGVGVGAVNVYMAVFDDGVITFHYDDISKHTTRVRERVLSGAQQNTSDGLAHGILDSVVDAFFPLVRYVDDEVDDIDSLTIDPTVHPKARQRSNTLQNDGSVSSDPSGSSPGAKTPDSTPNSAAPSPEGFAPRTAADNGSGNGSGHGAPASAESSYNDEKQRYPPRRMSIRDRLSQRLPLRLSPADDPYSTSQSTSGVGRMKRSLTSCLPSLPPLSLSRITTNASARIPAHLWGLTYLRLFFLPVSSAVRQHPRPMRPAVDRNELLQRIVEVRRIVTGMTRMLGAKHTVVGRLRKRMEDADLGEAAYVGDVEDHILLLQTSLYHYEYILSQAQPAYLSHIRWSYNITRRLISKKILVLSTVTVTILPLQTVTGMFSMNVRLPRNGDEDHLLPDGSPAGFTWFGGIVCIVFTVICLMCGLVRYWRWTARQRYDRHKGKDLPDWWEGYWGWK